MIGSKEAGGRPDPTKGYARSLLPVQGIGKATPPPAGRVAQLSAGSHSSTVMNSSGSFRSKAVGRRAEGIHLRDGVRGARAALAAQRTFAHAWFPQVESVAVEAVDVGVADSPPCGVRRSAYLRGDPGRVGDPRGPGVPSAISWCPPGAPRWDGMPGKGVGRFEGIAFWSLAVVAVGMILFVGGLASGVVPIAESGADQATQAASPQAESSARSLTTAAPVATTTAEAPLVVIRAVGGECWVEARQGSAEGRVLYVGLLARGQVQRLTAKQVWLRLGAGHNVVVTAGGRRAPVPPGTGDMVVTV